MKNHIKSESIKERINHLLSTQEAAIKYITENYLDFNRLRHDIVADKLQVRMDLEETKGERLEVKGWFCKTAQFDYSNHTAKVVIK